MENILIEFHEKAFYELNIQNNFLDFKDGIQCILKHEFEMVVTQEICASES